MRDFKRTFGLNGCTLGIYAWLGMCVSAHAFTIDTDNPDLAIRLDNTVRYNLGWRAESPDSSIYRNSLYDDSDRKFKKGDLVQNRVDLLTEFDLVYKQTTGFRLSTASWYDNAYKDHDVDTYSGSSLPSSYNNNRYSGYTSRYYNGPSGEVLDAFAFTRFNVGDIPVNVKVGRHTVFWGEGLLFPGHAISYSQGPIDGQKGAANPGSETKELFLPVGQVSSQAQITDDFSLAAQYFYEWRPTRAPEGGTYLGVSDIGVEGPDRYPIAPGVSLPRLDSKTPSEVGNFGLAGRWQINSWNSTLGLYYREFNDYNPAGLQIISGGYRFVYGVKTKLYGLSLAREVGSASLGMDVSYRQGTGLNTRVLGNDGQPARGDTIHLVTNSVWLLPSTRFYDTGNLVAEIAASHLQRVTHNADVFNGVGYADCDDNGRNKWDGCSTRNWVGAAVNFTPQWLQVFPKVDIDLPTSLNYGIYGNAAAGGGNQGALTWSVGIKATYEQRHELTLRYSDQFAHSHDVDGVATSGNGNYSLNDRGWVSLTLKTGF